MNPKLGYYQVNGQNFFSKINAVIHANETLADIKWVFNDDIFRAVQWTEEPEVSLDKIYEMRARQIREEYDYVIVMCSGGADSTNMVYSFLKNNIKVDEVVAGAPLSGLRDWDYSKTKDPNNIVSETMYAQLPLMSQISQEYPDQKITVFDYFDHILKMQSDRWLYEDNPTHWLHFSGAARHTLDSLVHVRKLAEEGKRIAVVYGLDKPVIFRSSTGDLHTTFFDSAVNAPTPHFKEKFTNVESVLFYYTPDFPQLMVKQAHEVCREIFSNENAFLRNLLWDGSKSNEFNLDPIRGSRWQRGIVSTIYPSTHLISGQYWQAEKSASGFEGGRQMDRWVYKLHRGERFVQMFDSDLENFTKNIHEKYFMQNNKRQGFIRFASLWKIGHESQFVKLYEGTD